MADSFLHALSQAGRHELVLRKQGYIKFTDGSKIHLKNRDIDKISLSLFDFNSVHDSMFIRKVIAVLVNGEIKSNDRKRDEKTNKYLKAIRDQYTSDEFKKEYIDTKIYFMDCQFYSMPQFLDMLKYSSDNETFKNEIYRTKHLSTGCKDWYRDYQFARSLK